jgi:hypothetical protein
LKTSDLHPGIAYDYQNGKFYRLNAPESTVDRQIFPCEDGYLTYFCAFRKKRIHRKASVLAYEILKDSPIGNLKVYHKNLVESDYRGINLGYCQKEEYKAIRDGLYNLNGGIRLRPHPNNVHVYQVFFRKNGRETYITFDDIVFAMRFHRRLLYRTMKMLNKYLVST